jgi:hypothetical protein
MGKLKDLDAMDEMLDEHFSNDAGVKRGAANTGRKLSEQSVNKISESNRLYRELNPLTPDQKQQISDAMRGKTLEELIGVDRAAKGRKARSDASKGKKRPKEVIDKIVAKKKATGVYESDNHGMRGKTHKDSTKTIQGQKAKIRQELKRKLKLGKSDSVPKDLLEKEYKKQGLL